MTRNNNIFDSGRKGLIIKGVLLLLVILVIFVAIFIVVRLYDKTHDGSQEGGIGDVGSEKTLEYNGQTYVYNNHIETLLVIGLDAFGKAEETDSYNNDRQADLLVLLVLDREKHTCEAIQINRDTITEVPILGITGQQVGVTDQQISLSHTYGNGGIDSCHNVAVTVSRMMYNLPIDDYVSLTMDGIKVLNDLVGGVTVTVLDDFTGVDDTLIQGEEVILMGDHALNYVRARSELFDKTNERRMVRQRQYMEALYAQGLKCVENNEEFVVDAVAELNDYIVSNCSVSQIDELFDKLSTYEFKGVNTIDGESFLGDKYMEFHYDEDALKKLVIDIFYKPQK